MLFNCLFHLFTPFFFFPSSLRESSWSLQHGGLLASISLWFGEPQCASRSGEVTLCNWRDEQIQELANFRLLLLQRVDRYQVFIFFVTFCILSPISRNNDVSPKFSRCYVVTMMRVPYPCQWPNNYWLCHTGYQLLKQYIDNFRKMQRKPFKVPSCTQVKMPWDTRRHRWWGWMCVRVPH